MFIWLIAVSLLSIVVAKDCITVTKDVQFSLNGYLSWGGAVKSALDCIMNQQWDKAEWMDSASIYNEKTGLCHTYQKTPVLKPKQHGQMFEIDVSCTTEEVVKQFCEKYPEDTSCETVLSQFKK